MGIFEIISPLFKQKSFPSHFYHYKLDYKLFLTRLLLKM